MGTQTDLTGDILENFEKEVFHLNSQVRKLESSPKVFHDEESFTDAKILLFTGLPTLTLFSGLLSFLSSFLPKNRKLSSFKVLLFTLMRLRLNISTCCLAYLFDLPASTASRIIREVVNVMYIRLTHCVKWPERSVLQKTMPMQFRRHFGKKCVVIIDCFEVFIERSSNLMARAQTWSQYKHHNTAKFLIGITPQGTVSFISNAWGGRASDKYITENSGFLDNILPGDLVLADRGFDIKDALGIIQSRMEMPAFTKGKNQLSPLDVETTRKIASVRIHVERVIGLVRQKYTILSGIMPIDFLTTNREEKKCILDKIAFVCCALVNLCPSIINFD